MSRVDLLSFSYEQLADWIESIGEKRFRAKQVYEWLMRGAEFSEMTNLSAALRQKLEQCAEANPVKIREVHASKIDGTEKYLFELGDNNLVEGVRMRYLHGDTLCVSTQVGCKMGCAFCASTLEGCARNLSAGEMLGQILLANRRLEAEQTGRRIGNVVLMGSGEPLDNYDAVLRFIRNAIDERGLNLSVRGISISTCGLVPQMDRLAGEGLALTLSLSLHAPNDEIRRRIMPIAQVHSIGDVLGACRRYVEKTGRRVIIEYALIEGVNDQIAHADELASRLRSLQCHVNLIPLNAIPERALKPPARVVVDTFLSRLTQRHISATRRREMGTDIQGACGQLRRRATQAPSQ